MDSEWDVSWWVLIWLSLSFVSDVGYVARVGVVNAVGHNLKFKVVFNSFLLLKTSKTWFYKLHDASKESQVATPSLEYSFQVDML